VRVQQQQLRLCNRARHTLDAGKRVRTSSTMSGAGTGAGAGGGGALPASLGVLRPASASALAPLRAPALDIPMREPLRWLASPPPPPHAPQHGDAAGGSADGADADAAGDAGEFVYVAFADDEHVRLDAGAAFEFAVRAVAQRSARARTRTRRIAFRRRRSRGFASLG
jgi:hypothetical protein